MKRYAVRWTHVAAVSVLCALVMLCHGCGMTTFYKTLATGALGVSAGYRALDKVDADKQTAVRAKSATDVTGARADFIEWGKTYGAARKALEVSDDVVQGAWAAAPSIGGVVVDRTALGHWMTLLTQAGATLAKALADAGVSIPFLQVK